MEKVKIFRFVNQTLPHWHMLSRFKAAPRVQLARSVATGPLRTHDDWRALQVKRAEVGTLSIYLFPASDRHWLTFF